MKRSLVWIVTIALLLVASQAFGQYTRKSQIEIYAGAAFPQAPEGFKDYFKMGYSLHGQYVIFPSPRLGVSFGGAYELFSFDEDAFLDDLAREWGTDRSVFVGLDVEGNSSIVELGVGVRPYITPPESNTQFFLFGMGTYNVITAEIKISGDDESGTVKADENKIGIATGAGVEVPVGETMNLILQGLYRFIFTEELFGDETTSFIGVTAGLVF